MEIKVITLTGEVATGKSTIAKALLQHLEGWKIANTGEKFRELTAQRGWTIQKVSFLPDDVHKEIDLWQRTLAQEDHNLIVEGRLAGWVTRDLSYVFRVFCYATLEIRAKRYMQREGGSTEKAEIDINYRDNLDVLKYKNTYGIEDYRDPEYYSLMLDTSKKSPDELAKIIIREAKLSDE